MYDGKINFGQKSGITFGSLRAGLKKSDVKNDSILSSIFEKLDKNIDGVLQDSELAVLESYDKEEGGNYNYLDKGEANNFLTAIGLDQKYTPIGGGKEQEIKAEDVMRFMQLLNSTTADIESAVSKTENGIKYAVITHYSGDIETINTEDNSYTLEHKNEDGTTIVSHYKSTGTDEQGNPIYVCKKTVETLADGTKREVVFAQDGKTPTTTTETLQDGAVAVIEHAADGKPEAKTVTKGVVTSNYKYDERGNELLSSSVSHAGHDVLETHTSYEYFNYSVDDETYETVQKTITDKSGKETVQTLDAEGNLLREIITDGDKETITEYYNDEQGRNIKEVTFTDGNKEITSIYDANTNELISQSGTIDGKEQKLTYENGYTCGIIVQNNESLWQLAKTFGCSIDDIKNANKDLLSGDGFKVGTSIRVPGQIGIDHSGIINRNSADVETGEYTNATSRGLADLEERKNNHWKEYNCPVATFEELAKYLYEKEGVDVSSLDNFQLRTRIEELQKLNPDLKNGELKGMAVDVTVGTVRFNNLQFGKLDSLAQETVEKYRNYVIDCRKIAHWLHNYCDDNARAVTDTEFINYCQKNITKDNVADILEWYKDWYTDDSSMWDLFNSESGDNSIVMKHVGNCMYQKLKELRAPQDVLQQAQRFANGSIDFNDDAKMEEMSDWLCAQIQTLRVESGDIKLSEAEAINIAANNMSNYTSVASDMFEEGVSDLTGIDKFCDSVAGAYDDFYGWLWGDRYKDIGEMRAEVNANKAALDDLVALGEARDVEKFKAKYKEIFGIDFDPTLMVKFESLSGQYAEASMFNQMKDRCDSGLRSLDEIWSRYASMSSQLLQAHQSNERDRLDVQLVEQVGYTLYPNIKKDDNGNAMVLTINAQGKEELVPVKDEQGNTIQYADYILKNMVAYAEAYGWPTDISKNGKLYGMCKQMIEHNRNKFEDQLAIVSGGKSLSQLEDELLNCAESTFAPKGDMRAEVEDFMKTAAIPGMVGEAVVDIAIGAACSCLGGVGIAGITAKWVSSLGRMAPRVYKAATKLAPVVKYTRKTVRVTTTAVRELNSNLVGRTVVDLGKSKLQELAINGEIQTEDLLAQVSISESGGFLGRQVVKLLPSRIPSDVAEELSAKILAFSETCAYKSLNSENAIKSLEEYMGVSLQDFLASKGVSMSNANSFPIT